MSNELVSIYVSSGEINKEPYYQFYTDSDGTQSLDDNNTLFLNKDYVFYRLNNSSHIHFI